MAKRPLMNLEKITADIEAGSRDPFRKELARMLSIAPDDESLRMFAMSKPDKYYGAIAQLSRLSGYQDGSPSGGDTNIYMQINNLSDMRLLEELQSALSAIRQIGQEGSVIDMPSGTDNTDQAVIPSHKQ